MNKLIKCMCVCLCIVSSAVHAESKRVLMLISSNGTEAKPELSYDLEELSQAYLVLHDNGVQVDIASPKGGAVLVKTNKDSLDYIQRFKSLALSKLENTLPASTIEVSDYQAIFVVGGAGAMIDLPVHAATQQMLTQAVHQALVITAVCHGPAALLDIQNTDGTHFVAGKSVNSFTNSEEHAFSAEHLSEFPFFIEDELKARGAHYVNNAPMLPFIAVDGNLITAQNPGSVAKAAEATVLALGLPLKARSPFADEATMELIALARSLGPNAITRAITQTPEKYDLNYLALYGFYAYRLADDATKPLELAIMQEVGKSFSHPEYDSQLIAFLLEQGKKDDAIEAVAQFSRKYPEHEYVAKLREMVQ
ncbi:type 1 glutamine amidotransferase domain-containing protein [Alteromonas facilis]|uniref:type 1 glutamine amidotransferase domain-containing protein n=1 Tax=Alteromonas facilis TaxID=2048004 RepID=UPI000C2835D2|nr:type 1 glutamine amidotransferase domain-containing protein [Alteromonas facilis]